MKLNFRQVHLDFHTSGKIEGIGEKFKKEQFQSALKAGHINSITLFSKCHHGWAYHPSEKNIMHPHLKFDLLKAQIEAAHEIGVKTTVYLSAGLDEKLAREHSDWLVRRADEKTTWESDFTTPGWHKFCMNTPYLDYFAKQVEETCKNYDADAIFFDIVGAQPCYCSYCIREREKMGVDPFSEEEVMKHADIVYERYAKAMRKAVDKYKPGLPLFHNSGHVKQGRRDIASFNTHLEIESLPTGGWGYDHFPFSVRYCQGLGMEILGMTGKFHTEWGDFGGFKHPNALRYEVSLSAANGAKCSVGDQLAPNGEMDMVTYELIGAAYKELMEKEPWLDDVTSVADVAVLSSEAYLGEYSTGQAALVDNASKGVSRIMLEGKYLFDVIDFESPIDKYKVIVLPDIIRISDEYAKKLKNFCKNGGKILATGKSALYMDKDEFSLNLGAKWVGKKPYKTDYFRPVEKIEGMGDTGYVMFSEGEKIECTGCELGRRENPYFDRTREHFCSHKHTPNSGEYGGAGMTEGEDGIYIAWEIFDEYANNGGIWNKQMVVFALDRLLSENKTLKTNLPAQGVVTLMKQNERYVCHLLYASPVKRGFGTEIIEDIIPVYNVDVEIKLGCNIKTVYLAPTKTPVPYTYENGVLKFTVEKLECHQMVVIE